MGAIYHKAKLSELMIRDPWKFSMCCKHISTSSIFIGCMLESTHDIYIYVTRWLCLHVWCIGHFRVMQSGWPLQKEGSWAPIQNSSSKYIWFRVLSNHLPFTPVCLSLNLAPSNGNWLTGFRCRYKCHCNYGREKSANKQRVRGCASVWVCKCMKIAAEHIVHCKCRWT